MVAIPPAPSSAPSAEFRSHHAIEPPAVDARQFRTAWRIRSQVDKLLSAQAISIQEWQHADAFRDMIERAFGPQLRSRDLERRLGANPAGTPTAVFDCKLDVIAALRRIEHKLGAAAYDLLVLAIVDDLCPAEIGRRLQCDRKTARSRVVRAVKRLAWHRRGGRPVRRPIRR